MVLISPIAFGALHQRLYRDLHENALGACTDRARWSAPNAIGGNVLISSSMTSYDRVDSIPLGTRTVKEIYFASKCRLKDINFTVDMFLLIQPEERFATLFS
ncbi:hypothetical protein PV325_000295 [Microctonus aethiopoides]|nr:hypothetical protein PV325_000295 [Microctonus aethiopoides]